MRNQIALRSTLPVLLVLALLHLAARCDADEVKAGNPLIKDIQTAIATDSIDKATVYVKAMTDGPDSDDEAVDLASQSATDGSIRAQATALALNDIDDTTRRPRNGDPNMHFAFLVLAYEYQEAVGWTPKQGDDRPRGNVIARPDDDPQEEGEKTMAAAAGAFSADGRTVNFCYSAHVSATSDGKQEMRAQKVKCSPIPEFYLEEGASFLASADRFVFEDLGDDRVRIHSLVPVVDLFHDYLQQAGSGLLFPVLRGSSPEIQELKRDAYASRVEGTSWVLSEDPGHLADLTIVGAALQLNDLVVLRQGRSDLDLLREYFASDAVRIVAPEHAQQGYQPQVIFRQPVEEGQDISAIAGHPFVVPDHDGGILVGLAFGIRGGIDDAVNRALNTEGHFVRELALAAWDGVSDTVQFRIPGTEFHYEHPLAFEDEEFASLDDDVPPTCMLTFMYPGPPAYIEVTGQDLGSGLATINVLAQDNANVNVPPFTPGTQEPVVVTATKINQELRSRVELEVRDVAGNITLCDPVLALVIRETGTPVSETVTGLPATEHLVTVSNGAPGLHKLDILVNGRSFKLQGLTDGEERTVDVAAALRPGNVNEIVLRATGKPGASATVLIWEGH
jgi:hypothetical protein